MFNTQYFYMEIVRFESQEHSLGGTLQIFLTKIKLFKARFVM